MCSAADDLRNGLRSAAEAIQSSGLHQNVAVQQWFSQGAIHFDSDHRHFHLRLQMNETARRGFKQA
jgi:hypothetical protein